MDRAISTPVVPGKAVTAKEAPARARLLRLAPWLALSAIVLCAALIRLRLIDLPLERDEGEYAYAGQLMLHGIAPYKLAWNMKLPGTYAAYAAIMAVMGQSTRAIHLGLLVVNAATTLLLYPLARRWFDVRAALAACATFALLSMGSSVLGMAGHATHFVILFAVAGTLMLFRAIDRGSSWGLFLSGLLYGTAFLMKQQGIFLALFAGAWLLISRVPARRLAWFAIGAVLPFGATCLILWNAGVFEKFWFWTFQYAREYASELTLSEGLENLRDAIPDIVLPNAALWGAAVAGLVLLWRKSDRLRTALPITLFLLFSMLAVCPGLYFRDHYFILMLPALALLTGAAVDRAPLRGSTALWLWGVALAISLFVQRDFLFRISPVEVSRQQYGMNPFPEAVQIADYIRARTTQADRIAVLGSEPEIYFYADRLSATGYIYTYGLMEAQPFARRMQDEMIREIEDTRPEYVVDVRVDSSWQQDDDSPKRIFEWWSAYSRNYTPVGLVDLVGEHDIRYRWGADAASAPKSEEYLLVLKRK